MDHAQRVDSHQAPPPTAHVRATGESNAAMVARSQILVSGSTATLLGTMTNETDSDVHFSGTPPYAISYDNDGNETILLGDFNSPPQQAPSFGDWVVHPGASLPYRSLPVTMQNSNPRWDGTGWSTSSRSTTMYPMTFGSQQELLTIQLFG